MTKYSLLFTVHSLVSTSTVSLHDAPDDGRRKPASGEATFKYVQR